MSVEMVEFELGPPAVPYVTSTLTVGLTLARAVAAETDLSKGVVSTFLPADTPLGELLRFDVGGKMPRLTAHPLHVNMERVNNRETRRLTAVKIKDRLNDVAGGVALFEDSKARPQDPRLLRDELEMLMINGDEVYRILPGPISQSEVIVAAMKAASTPCPPAVAVVSAVHGRLFDTPTKRLVVVDTELLTEVAAHVVLIAVQAYDLEGYLLWTRVES